MNVKVNLISYEVTIYYSNLLRGVSFLIEGLVQGRPVIIPNYSLLQLFRGSLQCCRT